MGKKPSTRIRRASEANQAVERILDLTNQIGADLNKAPGGMENAIRMRRGIDPVWDMNLEHAVGFEAVSTMLDRAASHAVVDLWRREGRVAYDVHPEMANSLYRSDLKGKLPGSIFSRIRHINPMIPLPHPWPVNFSSGIQGLIRAYFLTGRVGRAFCATTDERSEGLCIVPWIDTEPNAPTYHDILTPVFPLPSMDEAFTLDDMIAGSYQWHGVADGTKDSRKLIKQILPGALTLLSYLCCKNADIEKPPPAPNRGKRRQAPPREPHYVRVGWYIGPKLHAAKSRTVGRTRDGVSIPSGVEYGPQHRVGHTKTVWVGPGRKRGEIVWVDPYWTKLDQLGEGEEPVTQVVPVDPQQGDPSSHRDVKLSNLGSTKAKEIREREAQQAREGDWDW
jgi:hypothetical protein